MRRWCERRPRTSAVRGEIGSDARLVQRREQRIVLHSWAIHHIGEALITLPQYRTPGQRCGDLFGRASPEPRTEQRAEHLAVLVALSLVAEIGCQRISHGGNGFRCAGELGEIAEVPAGERHHHEAHAVAADEVLAVLAEDRVAQAGSHDAVDHHLGEIAQVGGRGQGDVVQRQQNVAAPTCGLPAT